MEQRLIRADGAAALERVAPLFANWEETLIWSALEGGMGCIWALDERPRAALCENADFLFLAGSAQDPQTGQLLRAWRREREGQSIILAPRDPACGALIEDVFGKKARREERYAFHKGGEDFDVSHLRACMEKRPQGVELRRYDAQLYRLALQNEWSRDQVSRFDSEQDYLTRGLGIAALKNGELVGGASSYTVYSKGIEVQIDTRSDWRRQGIASACGAALILACLERGWYPSWDAANEVSRKLAGKLGYREAGTYPVWELY